MWVVERECVKVIEISEVQHFDAWVCGSVHTKPAQPLRKQLNTTVSNIDMTLWAFLIFPLCVPIRHCLLPSQKKILSVSFSYFYFTSHDSKLYSSPSSSFRWMWVRFPIVPINSTRTYLEQFLCKQISLSTLVYGCIQPTLF